MLRFLFSIVFVFVVSLPLFAQDQPAEPLVADTLIVGTKEAPPFVIRRADGAWEGISIDLWREVADELGVSYRFVERELGPLLDDVAAGSLDVGVAALTITPDREVRLDFTHPFFISGLGMAVAVQQEASWLATLRGFVSLDFLRVVLVLGGVLLVVGLGVWLFERKRNPEQFGGSVAEGIASGFWWSAVTMTTVGYGDKAPVTLGGRLIGLVWMFAAILIISSFTAAIASALTVQQFASVVEAADDLRRPSVRVGTIAASASAGYLQDQGVGFQAYLTVEEALAALAADELDVVVHDAPILQYLARTIYQGEVRVLPEQIQAQTYGLALPSGSPLREPLSRLVLGHVVSPAWNATLTRYLGQ